jgi:hypothetical protein
MLALPDAAPEDALAGLLEDRQASQTIRNEVLEILARRGGQPFAPDLDGLSVSAHRAEGLAMMSYHAGDRVYEYGMLDLVVREDASVALICGRGTDDRDAPGDAPQVVFPILLLGLVHGVAALAGTLAHKHAQYSGPWQLAVLVDRLRGAVPYLGEGWGWQGSAYTRDEYIRTVTATTEDLLDNPTAVSHRLIMPLLRGLGVADLYRSRTSDVQTP